MKARAPLMARKSITQSAEWNEPIKDGQKKHVRFIWATQFGTGRSGAGATGRKTRPAAQLQRMLADRPGAAQAERARQEFNRLAKLAPRRAI